MVWQGVLGACVFLAAAWGLSEDRWRVSLGKIAKTFVVFLGLALLFLKVPGADKAFASIERGVSVIKEAAHAGTSFVFGYVGGGATPFNTTAPQNLFVFAFQALPIILVISALSMLLFHWRVLPLIISGLSWATRKVLDIGGALAACSIAKMFFGQTEAPLLVRPYLSRFSRNELFSVMTAGMATTSVTLFVLYTILLDKIVPGSFRHILTSSIINVFAALIVAELMIPERSEVTQGELVSPYTFGNSVEAVSQGALDGLKLMWSIAAVVLVMIALVYIANTILGTAGSTLEIGDLSLQKILGYLFSPITWLMGVPAADTTAAGGVFSLKTVINEIAAMLELGKQSDQLSPQTNTLMIYALCGFANFSSIAIQIGGIGAMVPERKSEIIALAPRALLAGTLVSCFSTAIVSVLGVV